MASSKSYDDIETLTTLIVQAAEKAQGEGRSWFLFFTSGHGGDMGPLHPDVPARVVDKLRKRGYTVQFKQGQECHIDGCEQKHTGFRIELSTRGA